MMVGGWPGSKILRIYVSAQMELWFIRKKNLLNMFSLNAKSKIQRQSLMRLVPSPGFNLWHTLNVYGYTILLIILLVEESEAPTLWVSWRDEMVGMVTIFPLLPPPTLAYEHAVTRSFESLKFGCVVQNDRQSV